MRGDQSTIVLKGKKDLDELRMRGLVWIDKSSTDGFECVGKAIRDRVCLEYVSRVRLDCVGQRKR